MATATIVSGTEPTTIDLAEATTNWGGNTFSLNTDGNIQGTNCVECAQTTNGNNDIYVTGTWNFSGGGSGDQHVRLWFNITFIGNLSATNPIQLFLYDGTNTAYYYWDKAAAYNGGWAQVIVDTSATPDSGTVNKAAITRIGLRFVTSSKPRNVPYNSLFDAWRYGDGYTITGGTNGDPIDWSHIAATDLVQAYGVVTNNNDVYFLKGAVQIGDGTSTTYFEPSGQIAQFADDQVNATLYDISFFDDVSAVTNIGIVGGAWSAAGTQNFTVSANNADLNAFSMDGIQISKAGLITFSTDATHSVKNCVFDDCLQITPASVIFEDNTIKNYTGTEGGALLWPGGTNVKNCIFQGNSEGIEHTSNADVTYNNITFSTNTNDVSNTANATSIDSHVTGTNNYSIGGGVTNQRRAIKFTSGGTNDITHVLFELKKVGSPTGNAVAYLYADGGTTPGTLLATSNDFDVTTLTASYATYPVVFPAAGQYTPTASTDYWIALAYTGGTAGDYIDMEGASGAAGEESAVYAGSWSASTEDIQATILSGVVNISATNGANPSSWTGTGTPQSAVDITNAVSLTINVQDENKDPIQNAQCSIFLLNSPYTQLMNEDSTAGGVATEPYNYPGTPVDIVAKVRKSNTADNPRYEAFSTTGQVTASGFSLTVTLKVNPILQ